MMNRQHALLGPILLACAAVVGSACGGSPDAEDDGAESASLADALTGSVQIGAELVTTTRVNFRRGPGTEHPILQTLDKGITVIAVNRTTPSGKFYNVSVGGEQGWVHGGYLTSKTATTPTTTAPTTTGGGGCVERKLTFSADNFRSMPAAGSAYVWGANATGGDLFIDPPYSGDFVSRARQAHDRGLEVFAYLEGPCGDTGGVDDGERARCANIHNTYNRRFAPGTSNTAAARWKPFTMKQLTTSGQIGVDYCEIDNLENNVTIPLNPLLKEIKGLYDAGKVHCRIVLKNVDVSGINSIRNNVAPTPADANFIAPFHIYEADDTGDKSGLDAAMKRLKGPGAVTIISTDTNHYGSAFTSDKFLACK